MSKTAGRPSPDPDYVLRGHQAEVQALLFHPSQDILLSGWVLSQSGLSRALFSEHTSAVRQLGTGKRTLSALARMR